MQTDTWLTEHQVSQERRRHVRGLLQARKHPNPTTPLPPQASAQLSNATPGSLAEPPGSQRNTSPISEEPTQPGLEAQGKVTPDVTRIDEITTVPPGNVYHAIT